MPTPDDDGAPTRFGPYTIRNQLGSGGMATVHVATLAGPGGFEKLVCIKRIRSDVEGSEHWVDSFITEAKLAAQIRHPNVVEVNDLGIVDGVYYIAMEYVAGVDVLSILRRAGDRGVRGEERCEVVGHHAGRLDRRVQAAGPPATVQHIPDRDTVAAQHLDPTPVRLVRLEPEQRTGDAPERISWIAVVLGGPQ